MKRSREGEEVIIVRRGGRSIERVERLHRSIVERWRDLL